MTLSRNNPLNWNVPIVNPNGTPTKEFMTKWALQARINDIIPALSTAPEVTAVLDVLGATRGDMLRRGSSLWEAFGSPSDAKKFLSGTLDPAWGDVHDSDLSLSDITTNDVSITKHGFAPKLPNDVTKFLDGTGAYSVPGGGGGGGDFTKLDEVVTAGGAATVSFAGISGSYRSLRLDYTAKSTDTGNDDISMSFQVNGDAGANYAYVRSFLTSGIAGGQSTGQTSIAITQITTNKGSNNAADFDSGTFDFINYADAAKWRHVNCAASNTNGSSSPRFMVGSGRWQNTAAAISSIVFALAAGNFVNGSVFSLYGIT